MAARLFAGRTLPAERRGGAVVTPEGGVSPRNSRGSRSGGSALDLAPILPNFVTPLCKGFRVLELPRVDQISDIVWQLAEKEDHLDLLHCGRLPGVELVPQDRGLVVPEAWVVQPFTCPLGGPDTWFLVRVGVGGGFLADQANAVSQRERELRQRPVEFRE